MHEQTRIFLSQFLKKATRADLVSFEALELPHRQKHLIDVSEQRIQRCVRDLCADAPLIVGLSYRIDGNFLAQRPTLTAL